MEEMILREAEHADLSDILRLYSFLHSDFSPEPKGKYEKIWTKLMNDESLHVLAAESGGKLVSSCTLALIPNLTHGGRPYSIIENVVTLPEFRNKGIASAVLGFAKETAKAAGAYKIMLLTGSKKQSTLDFYRKAGYNSEDKTAFIQWLE